MQAAADALIDGTPALAADRDLLATIPGVGTQTAPTVLAELPALDRVPSAQAAAAYRGPSPREFTSGSSVRGRTRLSKGRRRPAADGGLPADAHRRPVQPRPRRLLRPAWWRPPSRRCRPSGRACGSWC